MAFGNRFFLIMTVLLGCVGCDQATKRLAEFALKDLEPLSFFNNVFRLEYAENQGAFLSLGANLPDPWRFLLLTVVSSLILLAVAGFLLWRKDLHPLEITGYSLILAGGASNMIDRVQAGAVIDFLNVGLGDLRTGIFNVADMAIMAGLAVVLLAQGKGAVDPAAASSASLARVEKT